MPKFVLEITNEAERVLTSIPHWTVLSNLASVITATIRAPRRWPAQNLLPQSLNAADWLLPRAADPIPISNIIAKMRNSTITASQAKTSADIKAEQEAAYKAKILDVAFLGQLGGEVLDYTHGTRIGERRDGGFLLASASPECVYGPFLRGAQYRPALGNKDGVCLISPISPAAQQLTDFLFLLDGPLHKPEILDINMGEPSLRGVTLGNIEHMVERAQTSADFLRLYRIQASLYDLAWKWPFYALLAEVGRTFNSAFTREVDAVAEDVKEWLALRHPMCQCASSMASNLSAATVEGTASVIALPAGTLEHLLKGSAQGYNIGDNWIAILNELRASSETARTVLPQLRDVESAVNPIDPIEWLVTMRPILKWRGAQMKRLASSLWGSPSFAENVTLHFNAPPFFYTDGIAAATTAYAAATGLHQLVPLSSRVIGYHIERALWDWKQWSTIPAEVEHVVGDHLHPPDGIPYNYCPHALYMGEPGAVMVTGSSVARSCRDFGTYATSQGLVGPFKGWGPYAGHVPAPLAALPEGMSACEESTGTYYVGKIGNQFTAGETHSAFAAGVGPHIEDGTYMRREEGFGTRIAIRRTHPDDFYFLSGSTILKEKQPHYWYVDWPVERAELSLARSFTTALTSLVRTCAPSLNEQ